MMKELIFLASSVLILSTVVTSRINAQEHEREGEFSGNDLSPSALVSAAYRGRFEDWNIPSYNQLQSSYDSGRITALDLINAAIEAEKLPPQTAEDNRYINSVDTELEQLHED